MAFGKRINIFKALQNTHNIGIITRRIQKLILDSNIRQNSLYAMIRRALELKDALNFYCAQLRVFIDFNDKKVCKKDYLIAAKWATFEKICEYLEPLFLITKGLKGNADLDNSAYEVSYGAL